ncbi:hypothetical protein DSO57_1017391 [Entomophthora muscae]|uniref:Uncharacterized protein n=1 Tax=Entomophthora muscae TaxID=34485 RepID=A0ACC2STQ1_9FUNG|nr:hypothetical protein DSO57_1017391 [Entomophthora muscae]
MKFTEELSLPPLGNLRSSSLGTIIIKPVLDLAGASAYGGLVSGKRRWAGPWSMGMAARGNLGSGFESHSLARVSRGEELSILTPSSSSPKSPPF